MSALRRLRIALLCALALLVGQELAVLHDLGHATAKLSRHDSTPLQASCDLCALCAQMGGTAGTSFPDVPVVRTLEAEAAIPAAPADPTPRRLAFFSRGPPALS